MLNGSDAAWSNPVVFPWPANPEELPASKEELGECCGNPENTIKTANLKEEVRSSKEILRRGAGGPDKVKRRNPRGETWYDGRKQGPTRRRKARIPAMLQEKRAYSGASQYRLRGEGENRVVRKENQQQGSKNQGGVGRL
ncbi:hypothetical protein NDU88_001540 [Pleurodeles waltl]|uniref:Uncharacterized protein n=1 Tax=Pleurodeles waltl TaxID=8319 RepID=A0AAV7UT17_PLEWA|nr:hypothetical protein NDU88_001540 [Pleurodeles waltl]